MLKKNNKKRGNSILIDEDETMYLTSDNNGYNTIMDTSKGGVTTQSPVNGTLAKTKNITSDEYSNDITNNNYWWSRMVGGRNLNCSVIVKKKNLKELYRYRFDKHIINEAISEPFANLMKYVMANSSEGTITGVNDIENVIFNSIINIKKNKQLLKKIHKRQGETLEDFRKIVIAYDVRNKFEIENGKIKIYRIDGIDNKGWIPGIGNSWFGNKNHINIHVASDTTVSSPNKVLWSGYVSPEDVVWEMVLGLNVINSEINPEDGKIDGDENEIRVKSHAKVELYDASIYEYTKPETGEMRFAHAKEKIQGKKGESIWFDYTQENPHQHPLGSRIISTGEDRWEKELEDEEDKDDEWTEEDEKNYDLGDLTGEYQQEKKLEGVKENYHETTNFFKKGCFKNGEKQRKDAEKHYKSLKANSKVREISEYWYADNADRDEYKIGLPENGVREARAVGGNSGYIGYSLSRRALSAKNDGRYPKTEFKKRYEISDKTLQVFLDNYIIDNNEWHHTSKYGNQTVFYYWTEKVYADIYATYKKEILNHIKQNPNDIEDVFEDYKEKLENEYKNSDDYKKKLRDDEIRSKYNEYVIRERWKPESDYKIDGYNIIKNESDNPLQWDFEKPEERIRLGKRNGKGIRDRMRRELYDKWINSVLSFDEWKKKNNITEGKCKKNMTVFLSENQMQLIKERIMFQEEKNTLPSKILSQIISGKTSLGKDNPVFPPDDENNFVEKILTKEYKRALTNFISMFPEIDIQDINGIRQILSKILKECYILEKPLKPQLEKVVLDTIKKIFGVHKEDIELSISLVDTITNDDIHTPLVPETVERTFDGIDKIHGINKEIYKRRVVNCLIQGISNKFLHLTRYYINDIYDINTELLSIYKKIIIINEFLAFHEDANKYNTAKVAQGAVSDVTVRTNSRSKIDVKGVNFISLLFESIRAFLDLISVAGLPSNSHDLNYILKKSDFVMANVWDFRFGNAFISKIEECLPSNFNTDIYPQLFHKIVSKKVKNFNILMQNILAGTNEGRNSLLFLS